MTLYIALVTSLGFIYQHSHISTDSIQLNKSTICEQFPVFFKHFQARTKIKTKDFVFRLEASYGKLPGGEKVQQSFTCTWILKYLGVATANKGISARKLTFVSLAEKKQISKTAY